MSYRGTLVKRVITGADWNPGQEIKVHGYLILTPAAAGVDTTLKFFENLAKSGSPLWEDLLDISTHVDTRLEVNFSNPIRVKTGTVEVTGVGGIALIRYD